MEDLNLKFLKKYSTVTFINKYTDSGETCLVKVYEQYIRDNMVNYSK